MCFEFDDRRLFGLFACLLAYPGPHLRDAATEGAILASHVDQGASEALIRFRRFLTQVTRGHLEEIYTRTFDLDATCHPYVGYQLFGDGRLRWVFLAGLSERYRARGFDPGGELPDHLVIMLRFMTCYALPEDSAELIAEAILPALQQMTGRVGEVAPDVNAEPSESTPRLDPAGSKVYRMLLDALCTVLEARLSRRFIAAAG